MFDDLCRQAEGPPDVFVFLAAHPQASPREQADVALIDQFHRWRRRAPCPVEEYCRRLPALAADPQFVLELAVEEFGYLEEQGDEPDLSEFIARFPKIDPATFRRMLGEAPAPLRTVGRYRLERVIGQGSFSKVYLARDEDLQRRVAIKIPHRQRMDDPHQAEMFLNEARAVAQLDHPAIAPVFDVGRTDEGDCYVVSKFIAGSSLEQRLAKGAMSPQEAAHLAAIVAEALHHAHEEGFIHRDIKPANILLDEQRRPFLVDFGLALREEDVADEQGLCGTPAYMSPEQARGEGHLVDGRSDIFSLGVVLYEMLAGRRPFQGGSWREILEKVRAATPPPLRQGDGAVPPELERICLKSLAKRAADRYATARELADDLRHFLAHVEAPPERPKVTPKGLRAFDEQDADFFLALVPGPADREGLPESVRFWKMRVEAMHAERAFRIGLAYGPSGCGKTSLFKAGVLPRLAPHVRVVYVDATSEQTERRLVENVRRLLADVDCSAPGRRGADLPVPPAPASAVSSDAETIYVPEPTRTRRDDGPDGPTDDDDGMDLAALLTAVRRKAALPEGEKLLLVIDQFEQWLHARGADGESELARALRQCDGVRVQCVLLVRDDFWLGVSRFMRQVESRVVEGHNSALVDLFDERHAQDVLGLFGAAYQAVPEDAGQRSPAQEAFLREAVAALAERGKVVCVRLALFAEMVKTKPWTPETLAAVGGASGVGLAFLEETFSSRTAPPAHRLHEAAARAVLRSLLPDPGSTIKGKTRSRRELLEASGYRREEDFAELLEILDGQLRLLTPVERPAHPPDAASDGSASEDLRYQLTHDYLVPSLRAWLTQRQQATRRGRAELRLEERAALWASRPQKRYLPSLGEWLSMSLYTRRADWSESERSMMQAASQYFGNRGLMLIVFLAVLAAAGAWRRHSADRHSREEAALRVEAMLSAPVAELPERIAGLQDYRTWANPLLEQAHGQAQIANAPERQLRASLALLPVDATHDEYLYRRLLGANAEQFQVIRDALHPHREKFVNRLWEDLETSDSDAEQLRIASALAAFAPRDARWREAAPRIVEIALREHPFLPNPWVDNLLPARDALLAPLAQAARDPSDVNLSHLAADVLAELAADRLDVLIDALTHGDPTQFYLLYAKLDAHGSEAIEQLRAEFDDQLHAYETRTAREERQEAVRALANLSAALSRFRRPEATQAALARVGDPPLRAELMARLGQLGVRLAPPRP